jgi:glyoxylase-like metal-dependent hydrolase (beta-lactamase superfamily II)
MKKVFFTLSGIFLSLIAFCQSPAYEIYALKYAALIPAQTSAAPPRVEDSVNVDFMIWLIKGNDGKNILVDAGFLYAIAEAKGFDAINCRKSAITLQKLAILPESITDVIIGYHHWERADFKALFPNAHIWIQKEDYTYSTRTAWQKGGVNASFNKKSVRDLIDMHEAGKVSLVDGNKEIMPGISVYTVAGLERNSNTQYVLVKTNDNNVVLSSDNIWVYYNLEHYKPTPFYGAFDANSYIRSMQKMKSLVTAVGDGASQDSAATTSFDIGTEGIIKIK